MVADARALRDLAIARGLTFGRELGYDEAIGEAHDRLAARRHMRSALAFALTDVDLSSARPSSLEVTRHPPPRASRRCTFAVRARYPGARVLAWPPSAADVRASERAIRGHLACSEAPLTARVCGVDASAE